MVELIRIGNSQGVRIPKALIEQAGLEGKLLEFKITPEGLLIKPQRQVRAGWRSSIEAHLQQGSLKYDQDWLEADLDKNLPET